MIGTPGYMSPEQVLDGPAVTAATGRNAFAAASVPALLHRIVHEEPELDGLPLELDLKDLIDVCLDRQPGNRPDAAAIPHRIGTPALPAWWREEPLRSLVADAEPTPHPGPEPTPAPTVLLPGPAPSRRWRELSRRAALAAGSAAFVGLFGYAVARGGAAGDQDDDPDAWKVTGERPPPARSADS